MASIRLLRAAIDHREFTEIDNVLYDFRNPLSVERR